MIFYLSLNGCDKNPGTKDAPFASPAAARDAVRRVIANGLREPVTVKIEAGTYSVGSIHLDERDSGTADCPITWEACGEVIFNGGVSLSPDLFGAITEEEASRLHGDAKERVVRADLKKFGLTRCDVGELCVTGSHHAGGKYDGAVLSPMWCELFVNDTRQTIARYPDEGFLFTEDPIREGMGLESTWTGKKINRYSREEWEQVRNPLSDIYRLDAKTASRAAAWQNWDKIWMYAYPMYNWADMSTPIVKFDAEARSLETQMVSIFGMKPKAPYYFYNVFEELDAPGEWFLDRENMLLYLYPACELKNADINLSLLTESIIKGEKVSYLTFSGITFTGTRADALTLSGDHLTMEHCLVKNVAGNAMVVDGSQIRVAGCEIHHTGKGGVRVTGGDRNTLTPSGNVIENNHIHHIAEIFRTYQPAVSLAGVGNVCRHNCIHDSAHMAIGFSGNEQVMEYNEIYEVCKIADDSSAIYSGRDYTTQGNIVRRNYFHDMKSDADNHIGIFGMYCDDNLGSCLIEQNIFCRCQSALLLHGGHNMTFRGNVILDACPKSVYSVRFHRYGYWNDLLPGGTHERKLAEVPWEGEIWQKAYPQISEYLSWDPEKEQCYPHYADISGNVIINHKPIDINFAWDDPRFKNRVENNTILDECPEGSLDRLCAEILPAMIPGFAPIPVNEIGIR